MSYLTKKTLAAGQPGTIKWQKKFGDNLLYIRYKYDAENQKKIKTAEILIEEESWVPDTKRVPANKIVNVRITLEEKHLQQCVRSLGGKWNRNKQCWEMRYRDVINLGLIDRIIDGYNKEKV